MDECDHVLDQLSGLEQLRVALAAPAPRTDRALDAAAVVQLWADAIHGGFYLP